MPKSYWEAQPGAMLTLVKISGHHVPHGSWPWKQGSLEFSPLSSVGDIVSVSVSISLFKPHFRELWTSVDREYRMMAHRPHGARERICFAPSSPSQIVSFRDGCQLFGHDENSFAILLGVGVKCAFLRKEP